MEFNEWVIFIKESRDWHASKCQSIGCCLIERCDDDDNDSVNKAKAINFLRCLYDDSMRILLTSWISVWYWILEVIDDHICFIEEILKVKIMVDSWLLRNLSNIHWLY